MKKKTIYIGGAVLVVLLLSALVIVLIGKGNSGTVADNTENLAGTEIVGNTENIGETEELVADLGNEMDTIEGTGSEKEEEEVPVIDSEKGHEDGTTSPDGVTNSDSSNPESGSDSKPAESKPEESKPEESKPEETTKPSESTTPSGSSSSTTPSGSTQPESSKPAESTTPSGGGTTPSSTATTPEGNTYKVQELAAIKAGYYNVTYVPEKDMYVVLLPDGEIQTGFQGSKLIADYLAEMDLEPVPSSERGYWISIIDKQYIVVVGEVREKTNWHDTPPTKDTMSEKEYDAFILSKEEYEAKYGIGTYPY